MTENPRHEPRRAVLDWYDRQRQMLGRQGWVMLETSRGVVLVDAGYILERAAFSELMARA